MLACKLSTRLELLISGGSNAKLHLHRFCLDLTREDGADSQGIIGDETDGLDTLILRPSIFFGSSGPWVHWLFSPIGIYNFFSLKLLLLAWPYEKTSWILEKDINDGRYSPICGGPRKMTYSSDAGLITGLFPHCNRTSAPAKILHPNVAAPACSMDFIFSVWSQGFFFTDHDRNVNIHF